MRSALLLACLLVPARHAASAQATSTTPGSEHPAETQERIGSLLAGLAAGVEPEQRSAVVDELAALGAGDPSALLAALVSHLPAGRGALLRDHAPAQIVLEALGRLARRTILALAMEAIGSGEQAHAAAGLLVMGACGSPTHVALLFDAVRQSAAQGSPPILVLDAFEHGLSGLLDREPDTLAQIDRHSYVLPAAALEPLVRAIGRAGPPAGIPLLVKILDRDAIAPSTVLAELARLAARASWMRSEKVLDGVRRHLEPGDPLSCQTAALILGRLRDFESVPDLIELLDQTELPGVQENAYWALRQITGLSLRPDPERWWAWYDGELQWFADELPRVLDLLHSPHRADVVDALRQIGSRQLYLDQLAEELAVLLDHEDPELRLLATRILSTFGSVAIPVLLLALDDPDEQVVGLAHAELGRLTALALPSEKWLHALGLQ